VGVSEQGRREGSGGGAVASRCGASTAGRPPCTMPRHGGVHTSATPQPASATQWPGQSQPTQHALQVVQLARPPPCAARACAAARPTWRSHGAGGRQAGGPAQCVAWGRCRRGRPSS
jgi:hypothetical protein